MKLPILRHKPLRSIDKLQFFVFIVIELDRLWIVCDKDCGKMCVCLHFTCNEVNLKK